MSTLHLVFPGGEKPLVRFELTTHALRMRCSTPELQRQMLCAAAAYHTSPANASLFLEKNHHLLFICQAAHILELNFMSLSYRISAL